MDIDTEPLTAIAAALRRGELAPNALLEHALARQERFADTLNAYKTPTPDLAARAARAAESAFEAGADLGPLQGIPISIKDLYALRGYPTFAGTPRALPAKWQTQGPLVARVRRQLGVITGKTHTVELAFGGLGVNNHWGTPRNPWDAQIHRVPGGSSSGAVVSLCEGSALAALGTDTAGSVRIPASMTGNVGLKTGAGRWPLAGIVPLSSTLDTAGVMARTVADVSYAFLALDPAGDGRAARDLAQSAPDTASLRIGVADAALWEDCDPGVAEAVRAALTELEAQGAQLVDVRMPEAAEAMEFLRRGGVAAAECDAFLATELPEWRESLDPVVTARIADGGDITAREYLQRRRQLDAFARAASLHFAHCEVIASPTVPLTPPAVAELVRVEDYRPRNFRALRNTCVANFLSLCALSMPAGLDAAGLPVGLQLMAPHGGEERLLAVALACERVLGTARERLGPPPGVTPGVRS